MFLGIVVDEKNLYDVDKIWENDKGFSFEKFCYVLRVIVTFNGCYF